MIDLFLSRFNSFSLSTNGLTPENFLSRSKKEFLHSPNSETLIICIPSWGQTILQWRQIRKFSENSGLSVLIYEFPREIFSDNHTLTRDIFNLIDKTVRHEIEELRNKYKFKRCSIVAVSLGSSYGSMIYNHNTNIDNIILVCPGSHPAVNTWSGCRTQYIRKSYEKQGMILSELKEAWKDLACENNLPSPDTEATILYGKYDQVLNYQETKTLADKFLANKIKTVVRNYNCGHYLLIVYFLLFPGKTLESMLTKDKISVI